MKPCYCRKHFSVLNKSQESLWQGFVAGSTILQGAAKKSTTTIAKYSTFPSVYTLQILCYMYRNCNFCHYDVQFLQLQSNHAQVFTRFTNLRKGRFSANHIEACTNLRAAINLTKVNDQGRVASINKITIKGYTYSYQIIPISAQ